MAVKVSFSYIDFQNSCSYEYKRNDMILSVRNLKITHAITRAKVLHYIRIDSSLGQGLKHLPSLLSTPVKNNE